MQTQTTQKIVKLFSRTETRHIDIDRHGFREMQKFTNGQIEGDGTIDLNPDFQRDFVWLPEQQTAFMEHLLIGGFVPPVIVHAKDWFHYPLKNPLVMVDGKQRWTTVWNFFHNQVKAFGYNYSEFSHDDLRDCRLTLNIIDAGTHKNCIELFIRLNTCGTIVPESVIEAAKKLLI